MAAQPKPLPVHEPSYLEGGGIVGWLTTIDHKRVADDVSRQRAVLHGVRRHSRRWRFACSCGIPTITSLSAATYNEFFTMHGTTMIFLVVMPLLLGFLGNFLIPLQIGARDVAFPRLNALSFWTCSGRGNLAASRLDSAAGLPDAGWFGYANLTER